MMITFMIQTAGVLMILLAFLHVDFPRRFAWKNELAKLSLINKQVMEVHMFFIALIVLLMGVLSLTSAHLLTTTVLGSRICWGLAFFWFTRLIIQFVWYSPELWRGKLFETTIHILFSLMWVFFGGIFLLAAIA
ncbi:MAG: hypothetical protein HC845_04440 [Akkermansiaceae bacterium]|nr:hypothetical protein [Akkermansiaceae bacterium]NJR43780.1 hypothetical protein [Akkermansiaceae bacterium]